MTSLAWPGCHNARDLGGLPTRWGGRTRPGALARSELPAAASVATLFGHGVRLVLDLRLAAECEALPSPLAGHPAYRNLPVLREEDTVLESMADTLPGIYRAILERGGTRLAAVLSAIAHAPPGGVLVHCHSGKDRTGLVVALALTVAGVAAREIAADYALTASRLPPWPQATARSRRLFAEVTADTLLRSLTYLDEGYGGAEPYLLGAGLPGSDLSLLRARLTDP